MHRPDTIWTLTLVTLLALFLASGCSDDESPTGPDPVPSDATAPVVSIAPSMDMMRVDADLLIAVQATDNVGVVRVTLLDDGSEVGTKTAPPWDFSIPCSSANNGVHSYSATAWDAAGNSATSPARDVTIAIDVEVSLVNGDLEDGTTGWTLHNNDPWEQGYSADAGNPGGCLRLNGFGECEISPGAEQAVSGFVPGIDFTVSGQYKPYVTWIGNPFLESFVVTVDSLVVARFARGPMGEGWSDFEATFTATSATHTIGLFAEWDCDDSSYDVDNVELSVAQ